MARANERSGFSLIEVLVALAVLAVAGLALLNAISQGVRAAAAARDQALAAVAAESLLNTAVLEANPALGVSAQDGDYNLAGRVYAYEITLLPTTDPGLRRITLSLYDPETERLLAERVTFERVRR